jgi:hypothetical protein
VRAAVAIVLLLATRALAWDSRCYVDGGAECLPGRPTARSRWLGPSDEHRALLELGRIFGGLPPSTSGDFTLPVFTANGTFDLVFANVDPPAAAVEVTSFQPVAFVDATRMQSRTMSVPEFAQLPDHAYSLWDWAFGNETCPIDPQVDVDKCHEFKTHMGPVNSNHFVPQSAFFYGYYHQLALDRATDCALMKTRLMTAAGRFDDFPVACEREALVLEAVGQHFLQDAWASGHMWERWGSPDLADFPTLTDALLVAMTAGLIHGARAVLEDLPAAVAAPLGTSEYHFDDPLNAPNAAVVFLGPSETVPHPGVGDLYLTNLIAQQGAGFPDEFARLFSCEAAGLRAVYEASGAPEGPLQPLRPGLFPVDPTSDACFGQRVTNAAMQQGIGLDFSTPGGTPVRLELDSRIVTRLVPALSMAAGGNPNEAQTTRYRVDMAHIVSVARLTAGANPNGVDLASGTLPPLLGIEANGHFVKTPLASYVDPTLPWPAPPDATGAAADRAAALARTFHRAHAIDWCNRFHAGEPNGLDVDALRAKVATLESAGAPAADVAGACATCMEFAARHLRVGTSEADFDPTREPLCHFLADAPDTAQYVFQPGSPGDDVPTLARGYCNCECLTAFEGSVSDNIDQTDFTDPNTGTTRHGFEHDEYQGIRLEQQPDGTFTATGTFMHSSLDDFMFDGNPGERCESKLTETGTGVVTAYGGTHDHPDGSLHATATVTQTLEFTPCMGMPGGTDTSMSEKEFITSTGIVTPSTSAGCLTGLTFGFFFFDPTTNTTDSTSGQLTAVP